MQQHRRLAQRHHPSWHRGLHLLMQQPRRQLVFDLTIQQHGIAAGGRKAEAPRSPEAHDPQLRAPVTCGTRGAVLGALGRGNALLFFYVVSS